MAPALRAFMAAVLLVTLAAVASAQSAAPYVPLRPEGAWRTFETPHFVAHYPAELETWTRAALERMDAQREAVRRLVGWVPAELVTVVVADPYNDANGSAYPFLRGPAVFLWPVPPTPRDQSGNGRWAELLTVHEFAHLAHLARPTRNALRRSVMALLPTNVGPIGARTPRWVWEGYATYVEGAVTGAGRPFGVWRPAYLREWALAGLLPSYAAVSGSGGFGGGSFAYLAGSAYFEWLVAQRGDSSLPALWRRMTARTPRSFDAAFAGLFPGTPAELYARWTAQVTAEAIATERALRDAGLAEGTLVQRLRGATGDPAVSRDGEWVALVVRPAGRTSRVVVWRTGADRPDTSRARSRRAAARPRRPIDPEDVPAVPYLPPPKRAVATLLARDGRSYRAPRWLADGRSLLVERDEALADGTLRPDLWTWDSVRDRLRRVTHGAAVRDADPSPDGRTAIATRCTRGWCDLVVVDLTTGGVRTLVDGAVDRTFARPRLSRDGRRFAVAEQGVDRRWRVVVGAVDRPESRQAVGPDDGASRYDPTFLHDGGALVVTSEASGVPNLERIDLASNAATTISRVTGAAFAPEPVGTSDTVFALTLRHTGFDVRRFTAADSGARGQRFALAPETRVATGPGAAAAASAVAPRPSARVDTFAVAALDRSTRYGLGPRHASLLPAASYSADGQSLSGVWTTSDPVGRLTTVLVGAAGAPSTWRGGSLSAALRLLPTTIDAQLFAATQRIGATRFDETALERQDVRYRGALLAASRRWLTSPLSVAARVGGSVGRLDSATSRTVLFADVGATLVRGRGDVTGSVALRASENVGSSGGARFRRTIVGGDVALATPLGAVRGGYTRGVLHEGSAIERFVVGGTEPALLDAALLAQRLAMPTLPSGTIAGRRVEVARAELTGWTLSPFVWAGRDASRWLRVVGAQRTWSTGSVPFARAPAVRASAGAGYALDGPTRRHVQLYLSLAVRP